MKYVSTLSLQSWSNFKAVHSANMWMQYSAQEWPEAVDLDSAIRKMAWEMADLSFDALHSSNYDLSVCYDAEEVRKLLELSEKYELGVALCHKYSYGSRNLDDFCKLIIEADLKHFLYDICTYLPQNIIEKYQLEPRSPNPQLEESLTDGDVNN
ncbi:uncharacterized protein [Leptinotarsa decemlineata]|uniref:uncharacterized protein n=1 Tax=Leptinotarsa decemlineata TaxID=7539 RepID=UPI003D30B882